MDKVSRSFFERQYETALRLAGDSDILSLKAIDADPPRSYLCRFRCNGLVKDRHGRVVETDNFMVGIHLPDDYLRRVDPGSIVQILTPAVWHPNVIGHSCCLGRIRDGTSQVDILHQVHEILTWRKVTPREDDALNPDACVWARNNPRLRPVDRRPLKRRRLGLKIQAQGAESEGSA